ncbi:hypothetical protein K2Z83_26120 [Oscillochloris sp. ZM17-4]|nr:hypothetical protein [Oscillochloris sp. ZM17-4]
MDHDARRIDGWVGLHDAAQRCRVSTGTMREWARDGLVESMEYDQRVLLIYWPSIEARLSQPPAGGGHDDQK